MQHSLRKHRLPIDGQALAAVKRRFLTINRDRLRRVRLALRDRQKIFLDLLPLLFHINHPLLPGFLSSSTPAGISDYTPMRRSINAGRKLARSFAYQRRARRQFSIHALFLMGSSGTIAYSRVSDFDIWVCVRPDLAPEKRRMLARKAEAIEAWAASLGLEVHFFVMTDAEFRRGELAALSDQSSGSSQHHFLLDEFYRTALLVAGRYPIWWLVPPEHEHRYDDYVATLVRQRFVLPSEFVDFGCAARLPAGEFLGAALWQMYKGVSSPYKSVLKIMLMEAYAAEYPDTRLLSLDYKAAVHSGDAGLDELDPYVSMCRRVEAYLYAQGDLERVELARRCLYFKVNEQLSRPDTRYNRGWRRDLLRALVWQWDWSAEHLKMLDSRPRWKIERVHDERRTLVGALSRSYRVLSDFARHHADRHHISPDELNLLGRRLYAAFERKAGKVELVNPGISSDLVEEQLAIHQEGSGETTQWVLYRGDVRPADACRHRPLKRTAGLLELLVWCHFNGLLHPVASRISLYPPQCPVSVWELRSIVDSLQQFFPVVQMPDLPLGDLERPARPTRALLFVNLGLDPMEDMTRSGIQLVSTRTDALSYGGRWENLALSFDSVVMTSWQEVITTHFGGEDAVMDCLCDYLAWCPLDAGQRPAPMVAFSFSSTRGAAIAHRVQTLFEDAIACFHDAASGDNARYVVRVGRSYYVLQPENQVPRYHRLRGYGALLEYLGRPQERFSAIVTDPCALQETALPLILSVNEADRVQLFYQVCGDQAEVFVLDERGSLFHQQVAYHDTLTLVTQFQRFLEAVGHRHPESGTPPLSCYQVHHEHGVATHIEPVHLPQARQARGGLDVQVIGQQLEPQHTRFTLYCNDHEFSDLEYGERLFEAVARHVVAQRAGGQTYPIYITDIDVSRTLLGADSAASLQTVHFLNYKKRVEERLNQALARITAE